MKEVEHIITQSSVVNANGKKRLEICSVDGVYEIMFVEAITKDSNGNDDYDASGLVLCSLRETEDITKSSDILISKDDCLPIATFLLELYQKQQEKREQLQLERFKV
ncbi:MAG: hypothetical protein ACK5JD_10770 [Mangrovibacterium sp.]